MRRGAQQLHGFTPLNGSFARPQVRVAVFGVVVHMGGADVRLGGFESFGDVAHDVGVAEVEADPDIVEVAGVNELGQFFGRGKFVGNVFEQDADAERLGKGAQVLDGGHGGFEFAIVERLVGRAQVLHEVAERDLLGDFEGALDLVHSLDPAGPVGGGDIDRRGAGASPFVVTE